ncbi:MAG: Swt1 family HEPN domain-containing protein [Terriglobales bacterium]
MPAIEEKLRLFGLANPSAERDLDRVEGNLHLDLKRTAGDQRDEYYYPQFADSLRQEATRMGEHYEVFYCLERTIRNLIASTLEAQHGESWWDKKVPEQVRAMAKQNAEKELDAGITVRSEREIDYSNFGELGEIVKANWDDFDATFSSQRAFTKIMTSLNSLRAPIAHCCPLAEDEVVRLRLTVRDWFRLME